VWSWGSISKRKRSYPGRPGPGPLADIRDEPGEAETDQPPLARVVVGGMVTTALAIFFVLPLLARKQDESIEQHELEFVPEGSEAQVNR
jgi:hypothetical protein